MGQRVHYAMQSYRRSRSGDLITSRWRACDTLDEAVKLAERVVYDGKAHGAVALSERTSGDFEGASSPITVAAFGEVPDQNGDVIPF